MSTKPWIKPADQWALSDALDHRISLLMRDEVRGDRAAEYALTTVDVRKFEGAEVRSRDAGRFYPPRMIALHPWLTPAAMRDTLAHELAHALDYAEDPDAYAREGNDGHGARWREWMKRLGYPNPAAHVKHDLPELSRAAFGATVYRYDCGDCRAVVYSCRNLGFCNNRDCGSSDIVQRVADPAELRGGPKIV